jgi:hypothetical protein
MAAVEERNVSEPEFAALVARLPASGPGDVRKRI